MAQTDYEPKLTPEEYKEKKQKERDFLFHLVNTMTESIKTDPERLVGYLDVQARMDRYSVSNAMLIYSQCPNATRLKTYKDWVAEGGQVKKGSTSIFIMEPEKYTRSDGSEAVGFKVKKLFDISQVEVQNVKASPALYLPKQVGAALVDSAADLVKVEMVDRLDSAVQYEHSQKTIYVKRGHGDNIDLCNGLAVELAHAHFAKDEEYYDRNAAQFSAKCVGYMVCKRYRLDTERFDFESIPPNWQNLSNEELKTKLSVMRDAVEDINKSVYKELNRREQSKEMER